MCWEKKRKWRNEKCWWSIYSSQFHQRWSKIFSDVDDDDEQNNIVGFKYAYVFVYVYLVTIWLVHHGAIWDTRNYCYRNIFFHGMKTEMGQDFRKFDETEIKKQGTRFSKYVIYIKKVNIDKIIMPDKLPCTKWFKCTKTMKELYSCASCFQNWTGM